MLERLQKEKPDLSPEDQAVVAARAANLPSPRARQEAHVADLRSQPEGATRAKRKERAQKIAQAEAKLKNMPYSPLDIPAARRPGQKLDENSQADMDIIDRALAAAGDDQERAIELLRQAGYER